jgi:hypothetical protein
VLAVDGPQDAFSLRNLEPPDRSTRLHGVEGQLLVGRNDHSTGNRRQVTCLAALFVVLDQFLDLLPDDLPLIRLLARGNPTFEQVPVDLDCSAFPL